MKKILISLAFVLCACSTEPTNQPQQLRPIVDAGTIPVDFQSQYSEYIWADEPLVYIPNFGITFDQTVDSYIDVNSNELDNIDEFTVEFWFDPVVDSTFEEDTSCVVSTRDLDDSKGFWFYWQDQAEMFYFTSYNGTNGTATSVFDSTNLISGSNHVVIKTNSSSGFYVFLNGIKVADVSYSGYTGSTNRPLRIGACVAQNSQSPYNPGQDYSHFIGELDNFAYYDRELLNDEILQHYAVGVDLLNR